MTYIGPPASTSPSAPPPPTPASRPPHFRRTPAALRQPTEPADQTGCRPSGQLRRCQVPVTQLVPAAISFLTIPLRDGPALPVISHVRDRPEPCGGRCRGHRDRGVRSGDAGRAATRRPRPTVRQRSRSRRQRARASSEVAIPTPLPSREAMSSASSAAGVAEFGSPWSRATWAMSARMEGRLASSPSSLQMTTAS